MTTAPVSPDGSDGYLRLLDRAQEVLSLRSDPRRCFGRITLARLRRWPTWKALNYLTGLLGINEKSAKCVLMYCFGRQVVPVDTHTLRVSRRLGIIRSEVPEWTAARWLELAVPPELRALILESAALRARVFWVASPSGSRAAATFLSGASRTASHRGNDRRKERKPARSNGETHRESRWELEKAVQPSLLR